jgi:GSCFA family
MQIGAKIAFDEAYALTTDNPMRIQGNTRHDGKSGFERSHTGGFPNIGVRPKFKLSRDSKFFTIGSCFARNIEFQLEKMQVDVITTKYTIPGDLYELTGLGARNGALNAYTPSSMLELININARPDKTNCGVIQTGPDEWCDMLVTGIRPVNVEELGLVRNRVLSAYEEMTTADVVVVTLGFTESWFDNQDGMFVNRSLAGGSPGTLSTRERWTSAA